MPEHRNDQAPSEQEADQARLTISAGLFVALFISTVFLAGIGARYLAYGDVDLIHSYLILFFTSNLLVCYWEICLFFRRDYVELRTGYWRERRRMTGRSPARDLFATRVPLPRILSPTLWADVWAAYCQYDDSYSDRRTYGFNVDIANGFFTPVPTLVLYAAYTVDCLPALYVGILGAMLFWQWAYVTSVYWVSFFVAKRQSHISLGEVYFFILTLNAYWVLSALLGLYVSIRLIVDGNYGVLGF